MDHGRILIIAVLVSITFSGGIDSVIAEPTEEVAAKEDSSKFEPSNICNSRTQHCQGSHSVKFGIADSPVEEYKEEDMSKSESSSICDAITKLCEGPSTRRICDPVTKVCQGPHPGKSNIADSPVEASGEEDISKSEPSTICDAITKLCEDPSTRSICNPVTQVCQGPHPGKSDIADFPVEASGDEYTSKSEPSSICDAITKLCKEPSTRRICDPDTKVCQGPQPGKSGIADSPVEASGEEDISKSEPSSICDAITELCEGSSKRTVCNPVTQICTGPKPDRIIHEEEERISPLVCDPNKGKCQDPHHDFGVAKPRNEAA